MCPDLYVSSVSQRLSTVKENFSCIFMRKQLEPQGRYFHFQNVSTVFRPVLLFRSKKVGEDKTFEYLECVSSVLARERSDEVDIF